ncbi:S-adenosylmethionine uptake transporter [Yoonia tamlensis]|uniref:S-adenosylmethionine uptake transporter n=1 Tax=Yoonia tamlensis TaxID=390270 RepID=A0A1I6I3U4_9RHOB|nr:DMT family transporter [Yoonia tamlensis]SFR61416.1 S-adenosylmethionine uptake transporter [Yoonia tamlensis]
MTPFSENLRGAFLMVAGMCAYTVNDAFMKALSDEVPLFEAVLVRGIGAIICLVIMCKLLGQLRFDLPRREWALIIVRTLGEVGGTFFFLTALFNMPIANVSAILQSLPLAVSLSATVFLGEPLGWRRMAAISVGFAGVLLIVQPGGGDFNHYSLYALCAVACVTLRDIVVRRMSRDVPSVFVALIAAIGVTMLGAVGSLFTESVELSPKASLQLMGATGFLICGYICSVTAMRWGEISFVAPFRYTALVVALVLGVVVFGEWPNMLTLTGAGVVVVTGLFTLYRESRLRVRHTAVPSPR